MSLFLRLIIISLLIVPIGCKKKEVLVDEIKETSLDLQMIDAYNEGMKQLELGQSLLAAKKFNEAELFFPQSKWAPRAALMSAYSYYDFTYYQEAIDEVDRFLKTYPNNNRKSYAHYIKAMSYYNQIVDEKKDLLEILKAKKYFKIIIKKYPNTDFAVDSGFKLDLIAEILASKEIYLARYYVEREKWIPAINRFKTIIEEYETTIYVEEALHRLVELHYKLGLVDEAKKYAAVLGYNYQSSEWYSESYKILNKNYKKISKKENLNKQKSILDKFKNIFK